MVSELSRVRDVVAELYGQGLGGALYEIGLHWYAPLSARLFSKRELPADMPQRLTKAFESLGGAFVKLGQFLSLRPDLIPSEFCDAFKHLLDSVPPFDFKEVKQIIESDLKKPLESVFKTVSPTPIGSASIAQVHRAVLKSGIPVVIKLRRPDVEEKFESDLKLLFFLANRVEGKLKDLAPTQIISEFERYTKQELDFGVEAKNIEEFSSSSNLVVPKVYWQYCSKRVLVMDFLDGVKLSDVVDVKDKSRLAKSIAGITASQVFDKGVFHADLHPGNILLMKKKIGLLDFGIVGHVSSELRKRLLDLYVSLINEDVEHIIRTLVRMGAPSDGFDYEKFASDIRRVLQAWFLEKRLRPTHMMTQLFAACNRNGLRMSSDIVLFGKALTTAEGTCITIDPSFDFVGFSKPSIARLLSKEKTPRKVVEKFSQRVREISSAAAALPGETLDVLERIKYGRVSFDLKYTDVRHLGLDVETSSNRVAYALVISACIIGGALVVRVSPVFGGISVLTYFSMGVAIVFFVPLIMSVVKEGSKKYDSHENV